MRYYNKFLDDYRKALSIGYWMRKYTPNRVVQAINNKADIKVDPWVSVLESHDNAFPGLDYYQPITMR